MDLEEEGKMGKKKIVNTGLSYDPSTWARVSPEEVRAKQTGNGGWKASVLREWGIPWPPPKGWRQMITSNPSTKYTPQQSNLFFSVEKIERGLSENPDEWQDL